MNEHDQARVNNDALMYALRREERRLLAGMAFYSALDVDPTALTIQEIAETGQRILGDYAFMGGTTTVQFEHGSVPSGTDAFKIFASTVSSLVVELLQNGRKAQ